MIHFINPTQFFKILIEKYSHGLYTLEYIQQGLLSCWAWEKLKHLAVFYPACGLWGPPGARVSSTCSVLTKILGSPCSALVWVEFAFLWIRALLGVSNRNIPSFRLKRGIYYEDTKSVAEQCKGLVLLVQSASLGGQSHVQMCCRQTAWLGSWAQKSNDLEWNPGSSPYRLCNLGQVI